MTHQQLITTPDIDLMQLAERQDCEPSLKNRILAHLATLGAPTVGAWLQQHRHDDHAELSRFVRHRNKLQTRPAVGGSVLVQDSAFGKLKHVTRADINSYAGTL